MAWGAWELGRDREIASPLEAAKVEVDRQRQAAQPESVSFAVFELIEAAGREAQRRLDALLNAPGTGPAPTGLTKQEIIEAKALMQAQITAEAHRIPWPPRPARTLAPSPAVETALVAGPIIAWRLWRVWREEGRLYLDSISRHCLWPYGVPLQAEGAIGSPRGQPELLGRLDLGELVGGPCGHGHEDTLSAGR